VIDILFPRNEFVGQSMPHQNLSTAVFGEIVIGRTHVDVRANGTRSQFVNIVPIGKRMYSEIVAHVLNGPTEDAVTAGSAGAGRRHGHLRSGPSTVTDPDLFS